MVVLTESELKRAKDDGWLKNYGLIGLIFLVIFGMFYLPYRAGKNMFRGYKRNVPEIIVKTILMNLILIVVGYCIAVVLFVGTVPDPIDGDITVAEAEIKKDIGYTSAWKTAAFCFGFGALIGLANRPKFYRDLHNERFLATEGFLLVNDDREYPYQDGGGYRVKIMDPVKHKMDVLYYRHPNYRGYMQLDTSGRIQKYSGPIDLKTKTTVN